MAKAKYHKSQRVFVKPVGTWAYVEAVVPKWIKGCEEPIKITYDCGMGREFARADFHEAPRRVRRICRPGAGKSERGSDQARADRPPHYQRSLPIARPS